jgi:hypothetical protein
VLRSVIVKKMGFGWYSITSNDTVAARERELPVASLLSFGITNHGGVSASNPYYLGADGVRCNETAVPPVLRSLLHRIDIQSV